jgi:hypothetical protein
MNHLVPILLAALLFALFGLAHRQRACRPESCGRPASGEGCGACHLRPLPPESSDDPSR